jgi:hypothetical protein
MTENYFLSNIFERIFFKSPQSISLSSLPARLLAWWFHLLSQFFIFS